MNTSTKATRLTPKQKEAYKRLVARDGWANVTPQDAKLLATCRLLAVSQREAMLAKAQSVN